MSEITTGIAAEINRLHALATESAQTAMAHAQHAGELLLKVKGELEHGQFLPWLAAHCTVSSRQAQRYMRVALGKPVLALKCDTVSHLPNDGKLRAPPHDPRQNPLPVKPGFAAIPEHAMWTRVGDRMFLIEQSIYIGYFFVMACHMVDDVVDYLGKPIRGDYVDVVLKDWGLEDPASVAWRWARQERPISSAFDGRLPAA